MTTIYIILYLIPIGILGYIVCITLGVAGVPGSLFAGKPVGRSKTRLLISGIVSGLCQSYVYLSYTAFVVNWITVKLSTSNAINFIVWPFVFLAVYIPIQIFYFSSANRAKENTKMDYAGLVIGLDITLVLTIIGFFVFVFAPNTMSTLWNWVPYVGK